MADKDSPMVTRGRLGSKPEASQLCGTEGCQSPTTEFIHCHLCSKRFHRECINMDKKFFETLKAKKYSVHRYCNICSKKANQTSNPQTPKPDSPNTAHLIAEIKNELKDEIRKEIRQEMEGINSLIQQKFEKFISNKTKPAENPTVEQKTTNEKTNKWNQGTLHTILLKPKKDEENEDENETENGDETKTFSEENWTTIVKNNINPKLTNVQVSKVLRSKEGKGVLFFPTKESRDTAAATLKDTYTLESQDRKVKTLYPKIKISWISKDCFTVLDKTTIKDYIFQKNPTIKDLVEKEKKVFEIIFINDEKDQNYAYAVVKVDTKIKEAINSQGNKIYIGLSSCKVTDRYHLIQCYKCQEFGHVKGSTNCNLYNMEKEVCLYCAADHKSKTCPVKKDGIKAFKCHNCLSSKDVKIKSKYTGHTTTSFHCPILQIALKNTMNRTMGTSYKPNLSKNLVST